MKAITESIKAVNMPPRKRTKPQIISDRIEVARRYLRGETQLTIANAMEVTQQQISYDLKAIQEEWRVKGTLEINILKAEELAKTDHLERTYWEAWEQSRQPHESSLAGRIGDKHRVEKRVEQRVGNPVFLSGIQWCIDRRIKLLGLDAPVRTEVTAQVDITSDFKPESMTTAELLRIVSSDPSLN